MEEQYKEVYFDQYCKTCKHENVAKEKRSLSRVFE